MFNRTIKFIFIGALSGLFIWVADFDFFINFGGPETPLSDFLCKLMGLQYCCCGLTNMKYPPMLLFVVGGAVGLLASTIIKTKNVT